MSHPSAPALSAQHVRAALRWLRFARLAGARFDVEAKAAASLAFCAEHTTGGFAVPSALDGTSHHQPALAELASVLNAYEGTPVLLRLSVCRVGEGGGSPRVVVSTPAGPLGHLRRKHVPWVLPLLPHGLRAYALRVTGGTAEKPTRGCNVALAHVADALAAHEKAHSVVRLADLGPAAPALLAAA